LYFLYDFDIDAVFIVNVAVAVAHGDNLGAHLGGLFVGVDGDIAAARDNNLLVLELFAFGFEHFPGEVYKAVACCLFADEGAAVGDAPARESALVGVYQLLVVAVHIADFARAYADIAGGDIGVGA